jgi:glycosyltransferase involved in cell wall biosynthesis
MITRVLRILEFLAYKTSDLTIATNESYKSVACSRGGLSEDRVMVVRNGPDLSRVRQVPPDAALRKRASAILLYLGAMNPQDGLDYLLEALRHLVYELGRRDILCVLIGPGDSVEELKAAAVDAGLNDYVLFTGFIPDEVLCQYLSSADICLDPNPSSPLNDVSTWIKVMEYMAVGKPTVSFDLKETRFTAGDAALYVPPNDVRAFARAIATLLDNPELRTEMGARGKARVEKELNWGVCSRNLLAAYSHLLPRRAQGVSGYQGAA